MFRRRGPGLVRAAATTAVVAGTAGAVSHRQQQRYAAQDQARYDQQMAAQQTELKAQGILTEEEFEAKKRQILGI